MSPSAVTIGVETESRSQPRRYETTESRTVTSRISTDPRTPPTTEIVTRSQNEIDDSPKADVASFASAASHREDVNVVTNATSTFWASTPPRFRLASKIPAADAVPSRAPIAPKIVPRIPTAAGIRTSSPGRTESVCVIEARISPATNDAAVLRASATRPWRSVRCSARQDRYSRRAGRGTSLVARLVAAIRAPSSGRSFRSGAGRRARGSMTSFPVRGNPLSRSSRG